MPRLLSDRNRDQWSQYPVDHLSANEVAHLYRRAGFGASWLEIEAATKLTLDELVDRVLDSTVDAEFESQSQAMKAVIQTGNLPVQLPAWWLFRLLRTPNQAWEKLVVFWHGHFATSAAKVQSASSMLAQNETIRQAAFGPFEQLALAISRDPAMLLYLDSATNRRNHPNENYARELLELFCVGLGNYSEADIRELARAFTGWEVQRGQFNFNRFQHDPSPKKILGKSDVESGEQAVAWIVSRPASASFIATKLYRYYLSDQPVEADMIQPLADALRGNDFQIRPALRLMFTSRHFYSDAAYGQKIRSPVELAVGLLRSLGATSSPTQLATALAGLGQSLFFPPNVKGWDGGRTWINSATMIGRINLVANTLNDSQTIFPDGRERVDRRFGITNAEEAVRRMEAIWFPQPLSDAARGRLTEIVQAGGKRQPSRLLEAFKAAAALAEFQLG